MNSILKRMSAVLLALMIVLSLIPVINVTAANITTTATGYDSADDVVYVKNGNYIANWGARGETCVFLSTYAQNFYTGSNTFDNLSNLAGGSSQSNAPQSALYSALQSLMKSKHTKQTNYQETRYMYCYTDCVKSDYSKISSFYSGTTLNGTWGSSPSWNREHTWPNSKGLGGNDENDIMMLRPTATSENSSRGNTAYGSGSGYYDPGTSTRGDVARIVLYVYVRWGNTNRMWGTSGVMQSLDTLLSWMQEDPVDTWEMGRNDAVQAITGTRNVFVDYPEYAWLLFGKDVPSGITTPSDNDGVSANPGGNGGSTNPTTPTTPTTPSTPDTSYTQISSLKSGDQVVIVNPASNMALSMVKTGYYNTGVSVAGGFGSITNDEIFNVTKNSDGTYKFVSLSGQVVALADTNQSLNETGKNDTWKIVSAGGNNFYLQNASRSAEYLEWYASKGNWSTYHPDELNADYSLAFYVKSSSSSTTQPTTPATQPTTPATQPTTPATQPSTQATQPGASVTDPTTPTTAPVTPAPMPTNPVTPPVVEESSATGIASWLSVNLGDGTIVMIGIALVALILIAAVIVIVVIIVKKRKK